jgi:hypothetical protein
VLLSRRDNAPIARLPSCAARSTQRTPSQRQRRHFLPLGAQYCRACHHRPLIRCRNTYPPWFTILDCGHISNGQARTQPGHEGQHVLQSVLQRRTEPTGSIAAWQW